MKKKIAKKVPARKARRSAAPTEKPLRLEEGKTYETRNGKYQAEITRVHGDFAEGIWTVVPGHFIPPDSWRLDGAWWSNGVLARIDEVPFRPGQDEANAMFIVRAANTHEAFRDTIVHARAALSVCADKLATPEETLRMLTNILTAEKVDDALLISGVATEEERVA